MSPDAGQAARHATSRDIGQIAGGTASPDAGRGARAAVSSEAGRASASLGSGRAARDATSRDIGQIARGVASLEAARAAQVAAACDGVIDIAAALFNVAGRELRHPGRSSLGISRVRQIAMYVTHVALGYSMRDVGHGFGRDRTTVLYACHQIEDMREDEEFDRIVGMVERVVSAAFGLRAGQD